MELRETICKILTTVLQDQGYQVTVTPAEVFHFGGVVYEHKMSFNIHYPPCFIRYSGVVLSTDQSPEDLEWSINAVLDQLKARIPYTYMK